MQLRALVPAMAAMAAIPAAQAFEVAGDGWNLSIEPRIQNRIEFASASHPVDGDIDIWSVDKSSPTAVDDAQAFNFYVRRARLYVKGKSDDGFFFAFTLKNDKIGLEDASNNAKSSVDVHDMFIGKSFGSGDTKHKIQFGFDELNILTVIDDSSSKYLFPNARLGVVKDNDTVGFKYSMSTPVFGAKVSLGESESKQGVTDDEADLFFSARVYSGLSADMFLAKRSESFLGKDSGGLKHQLGLSLAYNMTGDDDSLMTIGLDYLAHFNQITGLAEFYYTTADEDDEDAMSFVAQGGYAIPLQSGKVVEPALRISYIDNNADDAGQLEQEGGASGIYFDAGVNYYIDGHSNKIQAAMQFFTPEEGDGDGFALRIAHNIDF